jgi:hypothetical protein
VGVVNKPQGGTPPPAPRAPPAGGLANGGVNANPFDALSTTSVRRPPEAGRPSPSPPAPQQYLEATICRLYYFSEQQKLVIQHLVSSMSNARTALTALAASNILHSFVQVCAGAKQRGMLLGNPFLVAWSVFTVAGGNREPPCQTSF